MREDCDEGESGRIVVRAPAVPGQYIMQPGFDLKKGTLLWKRGTRITPRMVGIMAGAGIAHVPCVRRPSVAVLSTGNEIISAGYPPSYGKTYDANAPFLCASAQADGAEVTCLGIALDDPESISGMLSRAQEYDLVLLSAGVSKGHKDHVLDAISRIAEVQFHGIAVKPGKPTVFAMAGSTAIFGLPGHPTSCFTIYSLLARPALLRLMGMENPLNISRHPLSRHLSVPTGRKQFLPVRLEDGMAVPIFRGSGALSSFQFAEGFAVLGEHDEYLDKGDVVEVIHLGE
jgi:molybdopterin molybdotransferase